MAEPEPKSRTAKLVLVTPDGIVLGQLQPVPVSTPWWQDTEPVVEAVKTAHGIDAKILRLLDTELSQPPGGAVTYLAEVDTPVATAPWSGTLETHPLRMLFAEPGGPDADLSWALSVLASQNIAPVGRPSQVRTWNLSSIWRIPTRDQTVWLKVVPPFFAHEGRLIASMQHPNVPHVLGYEGGRILLSEVPGRDMYDADLPAMLAMVKLLVEIQTDWQSRIDELIALGLPDWREQRLTDLIEDVFVRTQLQLDARDCTSLEKFLDELPRRFAELDACGIEDSLVHGDFHPGNVRELDGTLTLLDWGDAGIGHPMLDQPAFIERVPQDARQAIIDYWSQQWLLCRPGSNPKRASALIGPIAAARQAAIYRGFLDNIEPSERRYHEADPAVWLNRTADLLRQE